MRRLLTIVAGLTLGLAAAARAQTPIPSDSVTAPEFLSRYGFDLAAEGLDINNPQYSMDAHFGGDVDLVDYGFGRLNMIADYEVILGSQLRAFDPNQALYNLEGSASYRLGDTELAAFFHHVSRHLSDRPKVFAIDWNVVGGRLLRQGTTHGFTIAGFADLGKVIERSFVDYNWVGNMDLRVDRVLGRRETVFVHGLGHAYGVHQMVYGRTTQTGGLAEAGVHLDGRAGALELFVGLERRIDAYPLDFVAQRWVMFGFRLLGK